MVVGASAGLAAIVFLANATAVIVVPDGWECQPAVDSVRLVRFKWSLIIMPRRAEPPLAPACDRSVDVVFARGVSSAVGGDGGMCADLCDPNQPRWNGFPAHVMARMCDD